MYRAEEIATETLKFLAKYEQKTLECSAFGLLDVIEIVLVFLQLLIFLFSQPIPMRRIASTSTSI
jgi:hypothetical protein